MRKVTPRRFDDVDAGQDITIKFTRVQGTRRAGQKVTQEGAVDAVDTDEASITYDYDGTTFRFEFSTERVCDGDTVLGRDAMAKIE